MGNGEGWLLMRPGNWAPLGLDYDPVPGNSSVVSAAATDYAKVAEAIAVASTNLRALAKAESCESEAVTAIMEQAEEVANRISRAYDRYNGVALALGDYAGPLEVAQRWSVDALDSAITANAAIATAENNVNYYQARLREDDLEPTLEAHYQQMFDSAVNAARNQNGSLESAVSLLQSAISHRDSAAATASSAISDVENSGDLNDGWWDNVVQFINDHKELIDMIVNIVGAIATVAMLIALFIPGLNAIVAVIALVATIIQVTNAVVQGAAGTMSPSEAIFTIALSALTFVGGKVVSSMIPNATRSTVATSVRNSYSGSGISGMTQTRALDIVDSAGAFGRPQDMSLLRRVLNFGSQDKAAQLNAMANVELLSGANATGGKTVLNWFTAYNGAGNAELATDLADLAGVGPDFAGKVGSLTEGSTWRVGGNW